MKIKEFILRSLFFKRFSDLVDINMNYGSTFFILYLGSVYTGAVAIFEDSPMHVHLEYRPLPGSPRGEVCVQRKIELLDISEEKIRETLREVFPSRFLSF